MSFTITAVFYVLIGLSVAVAVWLSHTNDPYAERWFRILTAVCFWPIYLPLLLQPRPIEFLKPDSATSPESAPDEFATMIDQVEQELDLALNSLPEWSNGDLASEQIRIAELRSMWRAKADRLRELDELLARPSFMTETYSVTRPLSPDHAATGWLTPNGTNFSGAAQAARSQRSEIVVNSRERPDGSRRSASKVSAIGLTPPHSPIHSHAQSEQSRQENLSRLHTVRDGMYQDLINTLACVRELIMMIHLAKFTGAPTTRAAELIAQIAATVEELNHSPPTPASGIDVTT